MPRRGALARARLALAGAAALALIAAGVLATESQAAKQLKLGFADGPALQSGTPAQRDRWLGRARGASANLVLVFVNWSRVAPSSNGGGFQPSSPADPRYDWGNLDRDVREIKAAGLEPVLAISSAPRWAEGKNRGANAKSGTWLPNPGAFAAFGSAVARRYSGTFTPTGLGRTLPRVRYLQAWTEPNLESHIAPQWRKGQPTAAKHYRKMLDAFTAAVHGATKGTRVITAGTAPFGDPKGGTRMRPVFFWREVLCVGRDLKRSCKGSVRFDIIAHHAINPRGDPTKPAIHKDDATVPDLNRIRRVLRAAERRKSAPGGRHGLWMTEMWWETNPPDKFLGTSPRRQAQSIVRTMFEVWKDGASAVVNLRIRDDRYDPDNAAGTFQSGIYFSDGKPKVSLRAFRFPFLVRGRDGKRVRLWGLAPRAGKVEIQRREGKGGKWRTIAKKQVQAGRVFQARGRAPKGSRLRARVGKVTSLAEKS